MTGGRVAKDLLVSEIFGPTYQGEGPSIGQRAVFLRLSRCQLNCSFCDTSYTWDTRRYDVAAETRRMSQSQVVEELMARPAALVVITGGEPLLQQDRLTWVIDVCRARRRRVEIETNGAVLPSQGVRGAAHRFNVSPKLANSGIPAERRINPEALRTFVRSGKAVFKFVVQTPGDLEEIAKLEAEHDLAPIWVMPLGTTADQVLDGARAVADDALARGWNLTTRLHVLLWGDVRGR
ncbi:7-carboxy-7-deazaguanine synthase QueE [Actinoallomurus sp. NBC_01490]|uniref:7-carboxy-7-deazaguanine synthase QueE n=1 Tax=Actinoallomurus sp. NBC_01490 TaxID=2903557 RepID=UPI002E381EF1|nr:7-carboxy-7-deazaguanine synthase QueE [Actinoallomurus sp. NBC_01490]